MKTMLYKFIKLFKDVRYKLIMLEYKLYGIKKGFKAVYKKEFINHIQNKYSEGKGPRVIKIHPFTNFYFEVQIRDNKSDKLIAYVISYAPDKIFYFIKSDDFDIDSFRIESRIKTQWHKEHPILGYFIDFYNYFVYRLPFIIDMFLRRIYWFFQRGIKGYSDKDIWEFYSYLSKIISEGTKKLSKETHGIPPNTSMKEWKKILQQISEGFELINKFLITPTSLKEYKKDEKFIKKMRKKKEGRKYYPTKKDVIKIEKAFDLLKKYFCSLWD